MTDSGIKAKRIYLGKKKAELLAVNRKAWKKLDIVVIDCVCPLWNMDATRV